MGRELLGGRVFQRSTEELLRLPNDVRQVRRLRASAPAVTWGGEHRFACSRPKDIYAAMDGPRQALCSRSP